MIFDNKYNYVTITFDNDDNHYLCNRNILKLSEINIFNNTKYVDLGSIKFIPNNLIFNNKTHVGLDKIINLPKNVKFNNGGFVWLNRDINLNDITYKQLISIYNRLPTNKCTNIYDYRDKKLFEAVIREHKLNKIL